MSAAQSNGTIAAPAAADSTATAAVPLPVDDAGYFSAPRFAGLEWRVDVQRHSSLAAQSDIALPTAIVQIKTHAHSSGAQHSQQQQQQATEQQLQFELDRTTAAHVLSQLEKIDAIMAAAQ